jgi:hypothetical protein
MRRIIADITAVLLFNMLGSMFVEILVAGRPMGLFLGFSRWISRVQKEPQIDS